MALTINDVAARLNLPAETIHRWIRQGKIPMRRIGGTYAIRPELLELWANEHKLEIQEQSGKGAVSKATEPEFDSVLEAMQRGGVFYDLGASDCETALKAAVSHIPNLTAAEGQNVYEKLLEREQMASTGIGHGIALPHPRSQPDITLSLPQISTCFLADPIPFGAIDGRPVEVLMVLLSHSTKQHLTMLSKLSFYLREPDFRSYLLSQPPSGEILSRIGAMESVGQSTGNSR
jgi:nitrogen PTS system EIIA component